jgi:hypothetical protein
MYRNLDRSTTVTCFTYNWSYKHSNKGDPRLSRNLRKLSITLLFIPKANSQVNMIKHANVLGLHRQGQKTDSNLRDA